MQTETVSTASVPSTSGKRLRNIATIGLASIAGAGLLVYSLKAPSGSSAAQTLTCAPRLIVDDTSSETRSPDLAALTQQVVEEAAQSAVVCDSSLSAYAVSGGGQVTPIITTNDLASYIPIGPNDQIRSTRFSSTQRDALDDLITKQLRSSYHSGDPSITSIGALYQVVSEQSTSQTAVVIISTGVNRDTVVNLDVPLATGQGAALAKRITVPSVAAHELTMVGLAQVDASLPPPSAAWPNQVLSFNAAVCAASGASHCRLYEMASPTQILDS